MVGEVAERGCDFLDGGESQEAEGGVAEGGEVLRSVAGLHLALVLAPGDVADPVEPILDPPVTLPTGQEQSRVGPRWGDAGDRVLDFDRLLAAPGRRPLKPADLFQAWPIEMLGQSRADLETPYDGPAVALLDGAGFRERLLSLPLSRGGKIRA